MRKLLENLPFITRHEDDVERALKLHSRIRDILFHPRLKSTQIDLLFIDRQGKDISCCYARLLILQRRADGCRVFFHVMPKMFERKEIQRKLSMKRHSWEAKRKSQQRRELKSPFIVAISCQSLYLDSEIREFRYFFFLQEKGKERSQVFRVYVLHRVSHHYCH